MSRRDGYTLIEILVVVSISAMITGILVTYNSSGRQQVALSIEAAKLGQAISKAKSFALATYDTGAARCGFGVRIDSATSRYAIVSYTAPDCRVLNVLPATTDLENFVLTSGLVFGTGANEASHVFFIPPDPKTVLNMGGALITDQTGYIYLQTADGSGTRRVSVGSGGQITF